MPDSALTKRTTRRGKSFYFANSRTGTFAACAAFCLLVVCPGYAGQAGVPQTSFTIGEINGNKLGMSYTQFVAKHPEEKKYCQAGAEACGRLSSCLGMEAFLVVYFLDDQVYEISYSSRSESFGPRVLAELTKTYGKPECDEGKKRVCTWSNGKETIQYHENTINGTSIDFVVDALFMKSLERSKSKKQTTAGQ